MDTEKVPTGKLSRMGVYGSMATKVAINTLKGKVTEIWSSE